MKNTIITIAIILVLLGIALVVRDKESDKDMIKIGVIAGTTGDYASAGEGYIKGFNLAMEEWNNSDLKFLPIFEDDSFNGVKGLSAYKKLSDLDKVDVYAILSSFTIDSVYDLVKKENFPVALGFEQSKPAEDDNIFQVLPAGKPIQFELGKEIKKYGISRPVVVVSNNTPVYENFYSGFADGFGGGIKKYELGNDTLSIKSQALNIIDYKPDAVIFFTVPKNGALLIKEIINISKNKLPLFAFDQSFQSGILDYKNILNQDIQKINGSIVSMSKNEFTDDFKVSFRAKYNIDPIFASDMGYNSFMLIANTYNKNKDLWTENMKKVNFIGADGSVSFDANGLRVPDVFFAKIINGEVQSN